LNLNIISKQDGGLNRKNFLFVQEQILVEWGQDVLEANKETFATQKVKHFSGRIVSSNRLQQK
jgi:hypothetical protein